MPNDTKGSNQILSPSLSISAAVSHKSHVYKMWDMINLQSIMSARVRIHMLWSTVLSFPVLMWMWTRRPRAAERRWMLLAVRILWWSLWRVWWRLIVPMLIIVHYGWMGNFLSLVSWWRTGILIEVRVSTHHMRRVGFTFWKLTLCCCDWLKKWLTRDSILVVGSRSRPRSKCRDCRMKTSIVRGLRVHDGLSSSPCEWVK